METRQASSLHGLAMERRAFGLCAKKRRWTQMSPPPRVSSARAVSLSSPVSSLVLVPAPDRDVVLAHLAEGADERRGQARVGDERDVDHHVYL